MENTTLLSKLNKLVEGKTLQKARFGRSGALLIWLSRADLPALARMLREDPGFELDWLEHLSVMQMEDVLVATYFLRSRQNRNVLVLRTTATPPAADAWASLPSVRETWPTAAHLEDEVSELFGIRFEGGKGDERTFLSENIEPFPLRKQLRLRAGGH